MSCYRTSSADIFMNYVSFMDFIPDIKKKKVTIMDFSRRQRYRYVNYISKNKQPLKVVLYTYFLFTKFLIF
jgi:hypothetical protein